jgi:hypothetical protein
MQVYLTTQNERVLKQFVRHAKPKRSVTAEVNLAIEIYIERVLHGKGSKRDNGR